MHIRLPYFSCLLAPEVSSFVWSVNNYNYTYNGFSPDNDFVIDQRYAISFFLSMNGLISRLLILPPNFFSSCRGFKWIPESEAALFLKKDDSRLRLNTVVTKVKYSNNFVQVFTDKGDTIIADYAISTFS